MFMACCFEESKALGLGPSDLLISRARDRDRMLQTRRKVSILVPLGFPLDVFRKIACGFARVSVSSPSRYFVREQWFGGMAYGT